MPCGKCKQPALYPSVSLLTSSSYTQLHAPHVPLAAGNRLQRSAQKRPQVRSLAHALPGSSTSQDHGSVSACHLQLMPQVQPRIQHTLFSTLLQPTGLCILESWCGIVPGHHAHSQSSVLGGARDTAPSPSCPLLHGRPGTLLAAPRQSPYLLHPALPAWCDGLLGGSWRFLQITATNKFLSLPCTASADAV
jgi:hypothetical protein